MQPSWVFPDECQLCPGLLHTGVAQQPGHFGEYLVAEAFFRAHLPPLIQPVLGRSPHVCGDHALHNSDWLQWGVPLRVFGRH